MDGHAQHVPVAAITDQLHSTTMENHLCLPSGPWAEDGEAIDSGLHDRSD